WIDLGFFRYQPSETMKLALIMLLAKFMQYRNTDGHGMGLKELFLPLMILGIPFVFIVEQPDLGTALMIAAIGGTMVLFMKIRRWIMGAVITAGIVAAPIAWNYVLRDYQKNRIINF